MRVALICSSGGHLLQLYQLKPWWEAHERFWVTFDKPDAHSLLRQEEVVWAFHPTTRNVPNMLRNLALAWRTLRERRPEVVVSSGAGVAFPFFIVAKALGIKTVYIEVYDRIDQPTVTGKLCYPLSDFFLLQWEEQRRFYPKGVLIGQLLGRDGGPALAALVKAAHAAHGDEPEIYLGGRVEQSYDVFVTVGTDHHPFHRLVEWMDNWLATEGKGARCFVQTGTSRPPRHAEWKDYLTYEEMIYYMAGASLVVCHGGPGTAMLSLALGKTPIVVPRRSGFGEHVDDHQWLFSRAMGEKGVFQVATEERELRSLVGDGLWRARGEQQRISNRQQTGKGVSGIVQPINGSSVYAWELVRRLLEEHGPRRGGVTL